MNKWFTLISNIIFLFIGIILGIFIAGMKNEWEKDINNEYD